MTSLITEAWRISVFVIKICPQEPREKFLARAILAIALPG